MRIPKELWFGDERGYNATLFTSSALYGSCGLVMKEDITQPPIYLGHYRHSCGLVMKEDITQPCPGECFSDDSCGLVMKEDITQLDMTT